MIDISAMRLQSVNENMLPQSPVKTPGNAPSFEEMLTRRINDERPSEQRDDKASLNHSDKPGEARRDTESTNRKPESASEKSCEETRSRTEKSAKKKDETPDSKQEKEKVAKSPDKACKEQTTADPLRAEGKKKAETDKKAPAETDKNGANQKADILPQKIDSENAAALTVTANKVIEGDIDPDNASKPAARNGRPSKDVDLIAAAGDTKQKKDTSFSPADPAFSGIIKDLEKKVRELDRKEDGKKKSGAVEKGKLSSAGPEKPTEAVKENRVTAQEFFKPENGEQRRQESFNLETRSHSISESVKEAQSGQDARNSSFRQSSPFREQINELVEKGKVHVRDGKNANFQIRLNPKELGSVNMNLALDQGVVNGRFLVETQEARTLLMENLAHIKAQLESSGLSVGAFQVNVRGENKKPEQEHVNYQHMKGRSMEIEAAGVYEINSAAVHNGSINMVI